MPPFPGQVPSVDNCLISVVLAAKDVELEVLQLCIGSFAALRSAGKMQIVVVRSGTFPALHAQAAARFQDFRVTEVPAQGVYAAYNAGIQAAHGTYLLFFGVDDIALPGMDAVIDHLAHAQPPYDLFAAACYMQSVGISRPSRHRKALIVRNWCHQGIFYSRSYLSKHPYQTEYRAQADHKINIDIVSNRERRFGVSQEVVAYFTAGGVSSLQPDLRFRRDFPRIVGAAYGRIFGALVRLKQLLIDALLGDPERRFRSRLRQ